VLVRTSDGEVHPCVGEPDGYRAGRVTEIPEYERTGLVGGRGDRREVGDRTGPVRHVRQAHQGHVVAERRRHRVEGHSVIDVGVDEPDRSETGEHVPVGREVVVVRHDHRAPRTGGECCAGELVQVDAGRVGQDHLARLGAHDLRQYVSGLPGQVVPVRPPPDQVAAPLLVDGDPQPFPGRHR
jgi:hypothetical protein